MVRVALVLTSILGMLFLPSSATAAPPDRLGPIPPPSAIADNIQIDAVIFPVGDYLALGLDLANFNPASAMTFDGMDVELLDASGTAHTTDPLHPLLTLRAQRMLFERTGGRYYLSFHTLTNAVTAGNTDHFLGIFKKLDFKSGRIKLTYYVPDHDRRPVVTIPFTLRRTE